MQCQQRKARRCPRSSRQVPEADPAPPAQALELLPERLGRPLITVDQNAFYPGQFSTAPAPDPSRSRDSGWHETLAMRKQALAAVELAVDKFPQEI